jgi:UDP-glucose 4-epimerase
VTVLVTGATGFIGRHVLQRLAGRHDVLAIARREPPPALAGLARWVEHDLSAPLDPARLPTQVDTVLHLAQSERYREFPEGAGDVVAVNVDAPAALLDYARRARARRFVLCSTGGVYGYRPAPAREGDPVAPIGFYQSTKYAAEVLLAPYGEFLNTVILRPFFVYGPSQRGMLVASLAQRVLAGEEVTIDGDPGLRINPIHVTDAARAVEAALTLDAPAVVNVAGDEVVSISDLAHGLAQAAGAPPRIAHRDATAPGDLLGDNARMKALLGVVPEVPLADGLRGVVDELRAA